MKKSLLYIRLIQKQDFSFGIPAHISKNFDSCFDLDNFSDYEVVQMALLFLKSGNIKVHIQAEPLAQIQKLMPLLNALRADKQMVVDFVGEHKVKNYLLSF